MNDTDQRQRRAGAQDGAISIMAAVLAAAMVMATSLAVDVGRVAYTSRDQQGVTDRAVLDGLRHLGDAIPPGATLAQIHATVVDSVEATLDGNTEGSSVGTARDRQADIIELGYQDPTCPDPSNFCLMYDGPGGADPDPYPGDYVPEDPNRSVTAVRVATSSAVDFLFGFMDDDGYRDVVKEAVGTNRRTDHDCPPSPTPTPCLVDAEAGISVRSRLVELDTADSALNDDRLEILRQLVGQLIGAPGPTTVTAGGFDGLAHATVPLGVLGDAGATVGTTTQLLDSHVTLTDLFDLMASGATSSDAAVQAEARTALGTLSSEADPAWDVRVGDLLATTTEDPAALLTAEINTLDLLVHAAMNAEFANGDRLVDIELGSGLLGADLLGLDGLADLAVTLTVIEAPQMEYGRVRYDASTGRYETLARTAQVDLDVDLGIESDEVEALLGPLEDLLTGLVCAVLTCIEDVAISLSVAQAEADLAGIECVDPTSESDLTTIVTSDAVTATVDGGSQTLFESRDPGTDTVVVPQVPGEGSTSVQDTTLTNDSELDTILRPVLDLLGIDTGTAYVASWAIDCDVPVLLPNPAP